MVVRCRQQTLLAGQLLLPARQSGLRFRVERLRLLDRHTRRHAVARIALARRLLARANGGDTGSLCGCRTDSLG